MEDIENFCNFIEQIKTMQKHQDMKNAVLLKHPNHHHHQVMKKAKKAKVSKDRTEAKYVAKSSNQRYDKLGLDQSSEKKKEITQTNLF